MNENRIYWDFLIIIFAIYNSFALPMEIAFKPYWLTSKINYIINGVVDVLFAIDILISFRTTYICTDTGAEIVEGCQIAKNYLLGRFSIDLLATIPFDKVQSFYEQGRNIH